MTKRKRSGGTTQQLARLIPRQLDSGLVAAQALLGSRQWDAAHERLIDLDRRYPRQPDVVGMLMNLAHDRGDMLAYQQAAERLGVLRPDDPEIALAVAGARLLNTRLALALQSFQQFLARWPEHERAAEVQAQVAEFAPLLRDMLEEVGVAGEHGIELAVQHEHVQSLLAQNDWQQAIRAGEQAIARKPDFIPVLNNLSQAYFANGQPEQAIAAARRVLTFDATNYHALSNLTRFLCLSGQIDAARAQAAQLKALELPQIDAAVKQTEALSFLGDDQAVVVIAKRVEQAKPAAEPNAGLLWHFAAVAALRLGDQKAAQHYWGKVAKPAPWLDVVQANLDDLKQPIGARQGPWAFAFREWVPRTLAEDLAKHVQKASTRRDQHAVANTTRRFVQQHPALAALVPLLLDHGDPTGREFVLRLALMVETPDMFAALAEFALGQRGPDEARHRAAIAAQQAGAIPAGQVRLWMRGAWQDLILIGFEISDEPQIQGIKPQVLKLQQAATVALRAGDAAGAVPLLQQAIQLQPSEPGLYNNLASAYSMQRRNEEARTLIHEIRTRFPDYFFGSVNLAMLHIQDGELDAAQALLDQLLTHKRLHTTEFSALMNVQVELAVARGNHDPARSWLDMWAQADPDNPQIAIRRAQLAGGKRRVLGK